MSTPAVAQKHGQYFQALVLDGSAQHHFVSFTNSSSDSLPLVEDTTLVELFATQDCWILIQESTASAPAVAPSAGVRSACKFLPGGITTFIGIPKRDNTRYKVTVIRSSTNGDLHITEAA